MKYINKKSKFKKVKLIKSGICTLSVLASSISFCGCHNKLDKYYIVVDNHYNYICTKTMINNEDYQYESIIDSKEVGCICAARASFDYGKRNHYFNQKFLNELQVIPLTDALREENIDLDNLQEHSDLVKFAKSSALNDVVNNQCVRSIYYLDQKFVYTAPSKLQFFVNDNGVMIGYDVSPDREFNHKNKYIYSIYDQDVIEYHGDDKMDTYSVNMYLSDENIHNGYITFNEAVNMINKYNENHYQKKYKR